jgi:hypothetical protein
MVQDLFDEIEQRFDRLSLDSKLRVIEILVRRVRLGTPDARQFEREVKAMANDLEIQRELESERLLTRPPR